MTARSITSGVWSIRGTRSLMDRAVHRSDFSKVIDRGLLHKIRRRTALWPDGSRGSLPYWDRGARFRGLGPLIDAQQGRHAGKNFD